MAQERESSMNLSDDTSPPGKEPPKQSSQITNEDDQSGKRNPTENNHEDLDDNDSATQQDGSDVKDLAQEHGKTQNGSLELPEPNPQNQEKDKAKDSDTQKDGSDVKDQAQEHGQGAHGGSELPETDPQNQEKEKAKDSATQKNGSDVKDQGHEHGQGAHGSSELPKPDPQNQEKEKANADVNIVMERNKRCEKHLFNVYPSEGETEPDREGLQFKGKFHLKSNDNEDCITMIGNQGKGPDLASQNKSGTGSGQRLGNGTEDIAGNHGRHMENPNLQREARPTEVPRSGSSSDIIVSDRPGGAQPQQRVLDQRAENPNTEATTIGADRDSPSIDRNSEAVEPIQNSLQQFFAALLNYTVVPWIVQSLFPTIYVWISSILKKK